MRNDELRQKVNVGTFVAAVAVDILANALPLNGQTTAAVIGRFPASVMPAGYVFAAWGATYLFLGAVVAFQALPGQKENPRLRRVGYLPALSLAAGALWLLFWHLNQFNLSLLALLALLGSLAVAYLLEGVGQGEAPAPERWLVQVPLSFCLGWVLVATLANTAAVLYVARWAGLGMSLQVWAALLLAVGALVSVALTNIRVDVAYSLAIVWAYGGIALRQSQTPLVAITAGGTAAVVLVALGFAMATKRGVL